MCAPASSGPAAGGSARIRATGEIAAELVVSEKTVKGHTGNLFVKLQVEDRTQAAVFAWRTGIVHAQR